MNKTGFARAVPELLQRWRQQIAAQHNRRERRGPRAHAAVSFLVRSVIQDGMADLNRLLCVIVHDGWGEGGRVVTCCRAYTAAAVPWGCKLGGAENCRLDKLLTIPPRQGGRGRQFDLGQPELLRMCLDLDRLLERQAQFPHIPRHREPRLPRLWAAFTPDVASSVICAGPEYENAGCPAVSPISMVNRLALYPLAYVSHEWRQFATVLADLRNVPKRQIVALEHNATNCTGYYGAVEFDLRGSRFARTRGGGDGSI